MPPLPKTIFEILDREQVKKLLEPADLLASVHLLARTAIGTGLFWCSLKLAVVGSPFFVLVFLVCGIWHSFWGYAGIGHEFYHSRVFSSRWLNEFWFRTASYLTLNNPSFFAESHAFHHRYTFLPGDAEARSLQSWRVRDVIWYGSVDVPLLIKRLGYLGLNAIGYICQDGLLQRLERKHQREAMGMLSVHLAIHTILFACTQTLLSNLLFLLLPVTGLLPSRVLAQTQHIGLEKLREYGALKHSRSLSLPWLLEFLYAGMNFHAEHHLVPAVPYYHLPKLRAILIERGLLEEENLLNFLIHEFPRLIIEARGRPDTSFK